MENVSLKGLEKSLNFGRKKCTNPVVKAKMFPGMKFCNKFALSYLEIIVTFQPIPISSSQF